MNTSPMNASTKPSAAVRDDEATAVRVALRGTPRERAVVAARAMRDLLRDPDDTTRVFLIGILVNRARFPRLLERFVAHDDTGLMRDKPGIDSATTDLPALRALPGDTLGGAYARYLDANKLDPDLFQEPPGLPADVAYVAKRIRQTHDVWHVLTNYAPDVTGELALQAFTYAQLGMPSAALIAIAGTLKEARRDPSTVPLVVDGFRRGRRAAFLAAIRWEDRFSRSLDDVRRELGITPMKATPRRTALPS